MKKHWIIGSVMLALVIVMVQRPMRQEGAAEVVGAVLLALSETPDQIEEEPSAGNINQKETTGGHETEKYQDQTASVQKSETMAGGTEGMSAETTTLIEAPAGPALPAAVIGGAGILASVETEIANAGLALSDVLNYDWLIPNFYVVHNGTSMPPDILNPTQLLCQDLRIKGSSEEPQILIYHTHSQEAFVDSIPGDKSQTIVGVGDYLTEILTTQYGFNVIHHTGEYDVTNGQLDRDPAYSKALPALEQILAENPSIECVIDLHRDGVAEDVRLVTEVNGQPTARIMWFNGTGRDENGVIPGLENPFLQTNLAFSLQLRLAAMSSYPGLTRVNYLKPMRYNQHLRMSALIEVGAQTNTVSEAMNAMPVLADILNQVLSGN